MLFRILIRKGASCIKNYPNFHIFEIFLCFRKLIGWKEWPIFSTSQVETKPRDKVIKNRFENGLFFVFTNFFFTNWRYIVLQRHCADDGLRTWDLRYQKLHLYQLGATTTAALIRNLLRSSFVRIFQFQSSLAAAAAFWMAGSQFDAH